MAFQKEGTVQAMAARTSRTQVGLLLEPQARTPTILPLVPKWPTRNLTLITRHLEGDELKDFFLRRWKGKGRLLGWNQVKYSLEDQTWELYLGSVNYS